jgi:hypothetical protein
MKYIPPTKAIITVYLRAQIFNRPTPFSFVSASLSAITLLPANQKGMS